VKAFFQKYHRTLFYCGLLLLGLWQARYTELQDDEAYYWVYSRFPDWGYFDHPPMIAMLIKAGYAIFPNELGVRFFPLLMSIGWVVILEKLTERKNPFLFYAIILSIALIQLGGYMAAPDTPLLFFTALFFLLLKKFGENGNLLNGSLMGAVMALMLYSKYHAVLVIFFALIAQWRLLKKPALWAGLFLAFLLFVPHLLWQNHHDWVSVQYHLTENKVNDQYKVGNTLNYILAQLVLPGPFAGLILIPAAFLYKWKNGFQRSLYVTMTGFYLFFLLTTFRGKSEANWTSPAMVPLIVLSFFYLEEHLAWKKWMFRLLPLTLLLITFARFAMVFDFIPQKRLVFRFHTWKDWPKAMDKITAGRPVVFNNSYQRASKYWFYTGRPTYSLNWYKWRMNNFNFWPLEDSVLGKPAYYLDIKNPFVMQDSIPYRQGFVEYRFDSCFASYAKIDVKLLNEGNLRCNPGGMMQTTIRFDIPDHYAAFIRQHPPQNDTIRIGFFNGKTWLKDVITDLRLSQVNEKKEQTIRFSPGLPAGKYYMRFAINTGIYTPTHNSAKIDIVIE